MRHWAALSFFWMLNLIHIFYRPAGNLPMIGSVFWSLGEKLLTQDKPFYQNFTVQNQIISKLWLHFKVGSAIMHSNKTNTPNSLDGNKYPYGMFYRETAVGASCQTDQSGKSSPRSKLKSPFGFESRCAEVVLRYRHVALIDAVSAGSYTVPGSKVVPRFSKSSFLIERAIFLLLCFSPCNKSRKTPFQAGGAALPQRVTFIGGCKK